MSLDVSSFTEAVEGGGVVIRVDANHRLLNLACNLPWERMLEKILPDLRKCWWTGRTLRIRVLLGLYILQKMFNLTDRQAEQPLRDNAAYQIFCGYRILKKRVLM